MWTIKGIRAGTDTLPWALYGVKPPAGLAGVFHRLAIATGEAASSAVEPHLERLRGLLAEARAGLRQQAAADHDVWGPLSTAVADALKLCDALGERRHAKRPGWARERERLLSQLGIVLQLTWAIGQHYAAARAKPDDVPDDPPAQSSRPAPGPKLLWSSWGVFGPDGVAPWHFLDATPTTVEGVVVALGRHASELRAAVECQTGPQHPVAWGVLLSNVCRAADDALRFIASVKIPADEAVYRVLLRPVRAALESARHAVAKLEPSDIAADRDACLPALDLIDAALFAAQNFCEYVNAIPTTEATA